MPDLTIKPNAGNGNKVIIQDQAGAAVLTTADSGATIANATVSTGTIASAVTFPAGHVIQVTGVTQADTETSVDGNQNTFVDTPINATITPLYNNSKIIVHCQCNIYGNNTGGDGGYSLRFKRAISGGATSTPDTMSSWLAGSAAHTMFYKNDTGEWGQGHELCYQDTPGTTSAVTYTLQCAEYNMEGISVGGTINHNWKMFFMEVKV